jgi:hypothetical protein
MPSLRRLFDGFGSVPEASCRRTETTIPGNSITVMVRGGARLVPRSLRSLGTYGTDARARTAPDPVRTGRRRGVSVPLDADGAYLPRGG